MVANHCVLTFIFVSLFTASEHLKTTSDTASVEPVKSGAGEYSSINSTLFGINSTNINTKQTRVANENVNGGQLDEDLVRLHEQLNGVISKELEKAMTKLARVAGSASQRQHILRLAQATLEIKKQWGIVAQWLDKMSSDPKWRARFLGALTRDVLSIVCMRIEHRAAEFESSNCSAQESIP